MPKRKIHISSRLLDVVTSASYTTLFSAWIGLAFFFGAVYFAIDILLPDHGTNIPENLPLLLRLFNSIYFSVITATSTGYGDIVPYGFSKVFAGVQSISSLAIFAIFVTKLVSHRQELAIQEIHQLSYEENFHNIREDLFLVRKDFDRVIGEIEERHCLSDETWELLKTAYRQLQNILHGIPDFYGNGSRLYVLDRKREELLFEAVHRTLHRLNHLLQTLHCCPIDAEDHYKNCEELKELMRVIEQTIPLWKQRSPYDFREAFEVTLRLKEKLHTYLI